MKLLFLSRSFSFRQAMLLIAGCFFLVTLGVTGVAMVSRNYSKQGTRQTETLTDQFLPGLVTLARLRVAALDRKSLTYQFALAKDADAMKTLSRTFQGRTAELNRSLDELKDLANDAQAEAMIAAFAIDVVAYRESAERFQTALSASAFEQAMAILDNEVAAAQQNVETRLNALSERYFQLAHRAGKRTTELLLQSDRVGLLATIVLAIFTLLCLVLSLVATRALLIQARRRDAERAAAQDTLERRVEERTAALRASEERIRLIVDTASDAIITTDSTGHITTWNRQAETTFGWSQQAAMGGDLAEMVIAPRFREAHRQRLDRFLASGECAALSQRIEIDALHQDGHVLPIELVISPVRLGDAVLFSAFLHDITKRKQVETDLQEMHRQLMETSRQAGMAEVATGVLHNIGNVLNGVNVSANLVTDQMARSKIVQLSKIAVMLREHSGDVAHYLAEDPVGRLVPAYLVTLAGDLEGEQRSAGTELEHLRKNIDHIKDIVAMQQSYAKVSGVTEQVSVSSLVEDALRLNAGALVRHGLEVIRDFQADPTLAIERHKVLQILVNLIRNAKYACDDVGRQDKTLIIRITHQNDVLQIVVIDNGVGIPAENLTRIFAHGFTTRKDGHGFGLHSGALVAKEFGGSLSAQSDGPGRGATFILEIPCKSSSSPV